MKSRPMRKLALGGGGRPGIDQESQWLNAGTVLAFDDRLSEEQEQPAEMGLMEKRTRRISKYGDDIHPRALAHQSAGEIPLRAS